MTDESAVYVYKTFTSFLLGHLLLEVATLGASTAPAEEPLDEGGGEMPTTADDVDVTDFPTIVRLSGLLAENDADADFESALEALLDRLDLDLSQ